MGGMKNGNKQDDRWRRGIVKYIIDPAHTGVAIPLKKSTVCNAPSLMGSIVPWSKGLCRDRNDVCLFRRGRRHTDPLGAGRRVGEHAFSLVGPHGLEFGRYL